VARAGRDAAATENSVAEPALSTAETARARPFLMLGSGHLDVEVRAAGIEIFLAGSPPPSWYVKHELNLLKKIQLE